MESPNFKHICFLNMQRLTNFPYIEADFDALTNYELLCKVVEYLNKVIANENAQNELLTELYNAFVSLKNYVDNYFKNLDVQDEINNKLDEMAESGELTDIIAQYLELAGMLIFNTVNDMINSDNLANGSTCMTLGYHTINDNGGAIYKISDTATGYYEELNNLYAILLTDEINIKQFGAYGDNSHDDIIPIQNAIDYANSNNYKDIRVPKGTYLISKPILLYDRIGLIGDDRNNTSILKYTNTTEQSYNVDAIVIFARNSDSEFSYARGQKVRNLTLKSSNSSTYGIFTSTSTPYTLLENLIISDVLNGIYYTHGSWVSEFNNINISNVTTGIAYKDTGTSTNMRNIYIQNSTSKAYDINGLGYSNLENLCADWCTGIVYYFAYCNLVVNGLGSESNEATGIVELSNSTIVINSPKLFTNNTDSDAYVLKGGGSRLILNGGIIGGSTQQTAQGKFATINTDFYVEINKTKIRTNFLTSSVGTAQYNAIRINDEKNSYSIIPQGQAPLSGVGDIMTYEYQDSSIENMNVLANMGGIFFNVYGNPTQGATGTRGYTKSRKMGDIFVNQSPDKTGIAFFQQITEPKTFSLANPISAVTPDGSNLILGFTNLNLDSDGELKKLAIHVNDKVTSSSGGSATISSVDYTNSQLTIKSITGTFDVDDTVSLTIKQNLRDARFRDVQHLLSGTTSERILEPKVGIMYFDTTLGKPIWYKGSNKWVDATGTQV